MPRRPRGSPGSIGDANLEHDCAKDVIWRRYLEPRALFEAWSAPAASPWSAYAKPTLFAALPDAGSTRASPYRAGLPDERARLPGVVSPEVAVVLDLPGPLTVAYGGALARLGMQPVPLFNNWPHPLGVVQAEHTLGALLYYVPWAVEGPKTGPPVFLLDRERLGSRLPKPNDFDNRYFHNEADLPSAATLKRHGIRRLLYVRPEDAGRLAPVPATRFPALDRKARLAGQAMVQVGVEEMDDLNGYLHETRKSLGLQRAVVSASHWSLSEVREFAPALRPTPFSTTRDPAFHGFRRASAGGFGQIVPEPGQGGMG
jgi:hypothetical protein